MKKRLYAIITAITLVLVISTVVYAAYEYSFPIYVSDESGSARSNVPVMLGFGAQSLVDSGKINASGTDTNMGGIDYMLASEEVNAVIPSLPANANATLTLYTGFTPLATAFAIILGQGGYFTVNDDAAIELGSDFRIGFSGDPGVYLDTSVAGVIAEKPGALSWTTDGAGDVTAGIPDGTYKIFESNETINAWVVPTGATWYAQTFTPSESYSVAAVDLPLYRTGTPGITTVSIRATAAGVPTGGDLVSGTTNGSTLPTVAGSYRLIEFGSSQELIAGTMYSIVVRTAADTLTWELSTSNPYAGGSRCSSANSGSTWTITGTQDFGFRTYDMVTPNYSVSVSAALSGHYDTLELIADGTDLNLDVDGVTVDTVVLGGASVPDNANDWEIMSAAVVSAGNFEIDIAGTPTLQIEPSSIVLGTTYDTGTVTVTNGDATVVGNATAWTSAMVGSVFISADGFYYVVDSVTDATHLELTAVYGGGTLGAQTYDMYPCLQNELSADDYVGAITWGSNTDIDISYGTMGVSDSTDVETSGEEGGFTMPSAFMPSTWFASGDNVANLPFYDMIRNAAVGIYGADPDDLQEGVQTIYFIIIIGMAMAAFLGLVLYTRSALLGLLAMLIILFVGSSATIIPMWIPFVVLLIDIGIMFLYRQVAY